MASVASGIIIASVASGVISIMLASGSSALVAILLGEKKTEEADEKFTLICLVALVIGLLMALLGYLFIDEIIRALGATAWRAPKSWMRISGSCQSRRQPGR